MSVIQDIGIGLSSLEYDEVPGYYTRGEWTERLLTQISFLLGEVGSVTKSNADLEFILSVVGSYLLAKEEGNLPEDSKPPSELFDEIMFPQIDSMEFKKEVIGEGEEVNGDTTTTTEDTGEI